jgi:hypothetical protein
MTTSSPTKRSKIGTISMSLDDIPEDIFINHIVPFVDYYPYCHVAIGIPNFCNAYVTVFPNEREYMNFATVQDAKIYCDKRVHDVTTDQCTLCETVAQKGNLTVLKYLRSLGCSWDRFTCTYAAENGHLDVIKWCRENGCPWDQHTCAYAAEYGHLDVIQWCRQNGCPWDDWTQWQPKMDIWK